MGDRWKCTAFLHSLSIIMQRQRHHTRQHDRHVQEAARGGDIDYDLLRQQYMVQSRQSRRGARQAEFPQPQQQEEIGDGVVMDLEFNRK